MSVSLIDGWFPWTVRLLTVAALVAAIGLRQRTWFLRRLLPAFGVAVVLAVVLAFAIPAMLDITDPLPWDMWLWLGLGFLAIGVGVAGWRGGRWWQRTLAPLAFLFALVTSAVALNQPLGYYPTIGDMLGELTNSALPQQVTLAQLKTIHGNTGTGRIVAVDIPAVPSGFVHRTEYVYLPPAWFRSVHRPKLPVVEMIGGEFAAPDNWIRSGNAVASADAYAKTHHGYAPIMVFADATGDFKTDTECIGTGGKAEKHLLLDIPQYTKKTFGTATDPSRWAIAGWSMGGTCAVTFGVAHPEVFGHFMDVSGDIGPNIGDKNSTIAKVYQGDAAAWDANDPLTVLGGHAKYRKGTSGYFADGDQEGPHIKQAQQLSSAAKKDGIATKIAVTPGKHSWIFAASAFRTGLPWIAKAIGLPGGP